MLRHTLATVACMVVCALGSVDAVAQEAESSTNEDRVQKVREVHEAMREAEQAVAHSTRTSRAARAADEAERRVEDWIDRTARERHDRSGAELRAQAEAGSKTARDRLAKLLEEAREACKQAGSSIDDALDDAAERSRASTAGVREFLENGRASAQRARKALDWLIDNSDGD